MRKELSLLPHQERVLSKIFNNDIKKHILAMDTGTGKTIVGLTILRLLEGERKRCLIVCPPILIQNAWLGDNDEFDLFGMNIIPLLKNNIQAEIFKKNGIYICSYDMVRIYEQHFKKYSWDIIILDESHKICNRSSKTSRVIVGGWNKTNSRMESGLSCDRLYMLTGSVIPNKEEQIYQQLKACGYSYSWTKFKQQYFISPVPMHPYIIEFNEAMRDEFNKLVARYTTVCKFDETDLKNIEKVFNVIKFSPSEEQLKIQSEIKRGIIKSLSAKAITMDYRLTAIMKSRQVARGFITDNLSEKYYQISRTPYKMFEDFITTRADNEPYIVWYCFEYELKMLQKHTGKIKNWALNGGLTKTVQDKIIDEFKKSDNGVLFIQYAVGKNGLTLTNCKNMVFFSLEDNAESWQQSQARIHRIGQKSESVNYYVFICRNTIDEAIYQSLINKGNMIEDLKNWLEGNDND